MNGIMLAKNELNEMRIKLERGPRLAVVCAVYMRTNCRILRHPVIVKRSPFSRRLLGTQPLVEVKDAD